MPRYCISLLLYRLVLPCALLLSIALRPFGISILYLLLYLWLPLVRMPDSRTFSGWRGKVILVNFLVSLFLLLVHVAWHGYLASQPPYGSVLSQCGQLQEIAQNLGLVEYDEVDPLMATHLLAPELVMTVTSLTVYLVMRKLLSRKPTDSVISRDSKHQQYPFLTNAGKYISLFLIMFSGVLRPSVTSGLYYLVFIGSATAWAAGAELARGYAVVCRCVMGVMALHVAALLGYQSSYLAHLLPSDDWIARIFGFTQLVTIDCDKPNRFDFVQAEWTTFVSPIVILLTYYILALETRELFKPKAKKKMSSFGKLEAGKLNGALVRGVSFRRIGSNPSSQDRWRSATKKVRLIRGISSTKNLAIKRSVPNIRGLHQDSTESVEDNGPPSWMDDIVLAIIGFFQVLIRSSYIATSITMMAWSIMYHSWLTFVFLMWANVVWLRQNQRSFMLNSSPVLVCYAIFLLLSQFIYCMNLNEGELPSSTQGVNLGQIGFTRPKSEVCVPLLIKSLMACMFWVTLRQRNQEAAQRKQSSTIADMVAPLHLTVSTAASVIEKPREEYEESRLLAKLGELLKSFCTRYWIYVVTIMLFIIGITGERMTIFRIIYMFLFLAFILLFQISWKLWRKLMYAFWIVLIIYSMVNLVLVYIYQFDNFPLTIENYLHLPVKLQYDLGLEKYNKADLFVRLLTPTCFLVITIMQVHYFHNDFLDMSHLRSSTSREASARASQSGVTSTKDDAPGPSSDHEQPAAGQERDSSDLEQSIEMSSLNRRSTRRSTRRSRSKSYPPTLTERTSISFRDCALIFLHKLRLMYTGCRDLVFLYLEIHLIKITFLALMLLCVLNVCALHVPIMLIISPGLLLNSKRQKLCAILISVLVSAYLMAKMIYQIDYIPHSLFDVNCTTNVSTIGNVTTSNVTTFNNAEWVGFVKANKDHKLPKLLKGYITVIAIFTFHSMVMYRQQRFRSFGLSDANKDKIMFPNITRKEADKDLPSCLKYLLNYGFYKFGVEATLICLVGVIGSRMDVYAMAYAGWLLALVAMPRARQACVWPAFTGFVTVLLPLQYMIAVGVLPQFCVQYPWAGEDRQLQSMRHWLFLPYAEEPPHATKIIFDYFLLLFCARQRRVFHLERQHGEQYAGGSNCEGVGKDWETLGFVNPVPDFLNFIGSYLDVVKRLVFLGMLWVTLAIMFLTGTNRVNLFSMGYLIGSFIFLWQGTDFYLRPKNSVLKWWSWLLRYNVCVVVIKTLLQIPGCMFNTLLQENACWLVQLLGIGCVDKFAGGSLHSFLRMEAGSYKNAEMTCAVPQEDIGLAWDGVCFAFLLLQRRFFHSYYFYRVIDESKATTVLASRGAELIEELRQKQMRQQEAAEGKILEKIKVKMERIKANQKKIQGPSYAEAPQHDAEDEEGTVGAESERAPLVHGDSETSARGYHTPESAGSPRGFHTPISDESSPPSPTTTPPPSSPERTAVPAVGYVPPAVGVAPPGQIPPAPPSPSSALMTVSLDAYLEPQRLSYSSPPASELMPRAHSPEESYPVFSPPLPRRRHTVASPQPQRTSLISHSSRSANYSHHTSVRSGDYYMFDEFDDVDDVDITSLQEDESSTDEDLPKEMGLGKLLSTVIKTDLRRAVSLRRSSAPAVRAARHLSVASDLTFPRHTPRRESLKQTEMAAHPSMVEITLGDQTERELSDLGLEPMEDETIIDKLKHYLLVVRAFVESLIVSLTRHLLRYSRDYRYVSKALFNEKRILKEKPGFGIGIREGSQMIWQPLPEALVSRSAKSSPRDVYQLLEEPVFLKSSFVGRKLSNLSVPEIRILAPSMERGLDAHTPDSRRRRAAAKLDTDSDSDNESRSRRPDSVYSLPSTESKDPSSLDEQEDSMFQKDKSPIVHFVCALWYAVVSHTDIVCYLMVFINQIQSATILSIPLPLMVFTWGTLTIPRPTKTFWVTLIAYTEVIVLVKSMFQFEILPWNQKAIPINMPFTAPRVIGIERKSNYALYDLLLLLIIFFHRFVLKSLGLWKESATEVELREDALYTITADETRMIAEGDGELVGRRYAEKHSKTGGIKRQPKIQEDIAVEEEEEEEEEEEDEEEEGKQSLDREIEEEPTKLDVPGTSRELDDDHYKVNDDEEPIIGVSTVLEDANKHLPHIMRLAVQRYLRPVHQFFVRMLDPTARVTADVYAYMFMCDFFNFLVVIFGFAAFGTHQGDGGVQAYLEENKVPIPFLVMLILQFALIIIDRALYLRKFILGKILFQYGLIIGVHIWMFFVLPFITERTFNTLMPPPMWYMVKCIYLLLSAYQIRCGYPRRIIGNFLCKGYNYINMFLFRGFMAVPFVFELRTLMDWVWTDTSMTLMDWLKMEDIFANVFLLKCSRYVEDEFPQPRGTKKTPMSKYLMGGTALAFIIAIIWFPLVLFAFGNTVGKSNPPTDVTVKIRIGPFLPAYMMTAQSHNIDLFSMQDYEQLSNLYAKDRTAQTFLSNYMYDDVAAVSLNADSTNVWAISPPELQRLELEAASNESLAIKLTYVLTHPTNSKDNPPTIEEEREVTLEPLVNGTRNPQRVTLYNMLSGQSNAEWLLVKALFPKFVKVFNKGTAKPAYQLINSPAKDMVEQQYRNVMMQLEYSNVSGVCYWRVKEDCTTDHSNNGQLKSIAMNDCDKLVMYTFNDKLFPETLNFISGSGIIGLYTTFVFLASRLLRGFFSGIYSKIMFEDLPNVDRVLQMCLDIYLVREAMELALEEDLFAKLVFLYRSPETMIKWTRPKDEPEERAEVEGAPRPRSPPPPHN